MSPESVITKGVEAMPLTREAILPEYLSSSVERYISFFQERIASSTEDQNDRTEKARTTIEKAIHRNNRMSEVLDSEEYKEIDQRTKKLLGDCKLGVIDCMDGRIKTALIFGTSADVSQQMAAVLPTALSADTGELTIDSSTVKIAVINAPMKDNPNLLQVAVAHASSDFEEDESKNADQELISNCAAAEEIKNQMLRARQKVDPDLIKLNLESLKPGIEAIQRTYNSSAEINGKPKLDKVAVRMIYDTDSMGFFLGYGEEVTLFTTEMTKEFSARISELTSQTQDARYQNPGALRYSYTDLEQFVSNEKMYLDVVEHLMSDSDFVTKINSFCDIGADSEFCGLNQSQKQGLRYLVARNIAFQYLTGVHLEQLSQERPFAAHAEEYMSVSLDDGHGMTVGGMDTESQVFCAVTSRIQNAVDHIHTMSYLMKKHSAPKPFVLFVSEGIEETVSTNQGSLDAVSSKLDNTYKEIQKDEQISQMIKDGELLMIPVIQSSRTGRVIKVLETPLV